MCKFGALEQAPDQVVLLNDWTFTALVDLEGLVKHFLPSEVHLHLMNRNQTLVGVVVLEWGATTYVALT